VTSYFLKIGLQGGNRIAGNSFDINYPGWIDIDSWSPGMAAPAGSSTGPGKASVSEFHFVRPSDRMVSARIFLACQTAENFDGAILAITGARNPGRIQFDNVLITSCQTRSGNTGPLDAFTLSFVGMHFIAGAAPSLPPEGLGQIALTAAAMAAASLIAPSSIPALAGLLRDRGRLPGP
jgi:type VI protein secretion system component Hcp